MTPDQLAVIMECRIERARVWADPIVKAATRYDILPPHRLAPFLANVKEESGGLVFLRELWGPTPAQRGYEGRADLGNTHAGDGRLYCGRGLFGLTGRANYTAYAKASGVACVTYPELLEHPEYAVDSAGWFWRDVKHLNPLADADDFRGIVRRINGGYTHYDKRYATWQLALQVLAP